MERQSINEFGLLFTRLCELKQSFAEQNEDMVIQFEENEAKCLKNLFYQTP